MGDATYAMEYVSQIATGSTLTLSESIALRVALHRLLKFLHLGENGYQSLLEVAWAEKHQGLIYSLLDVLDCAATEISRNIEPTNHIIPTGQFAETILNTIADLLQLVSGLLPLSPITSRTSSRLTAAIVTIQSVVHYLLNDLSDNSSLSKAVNAAGNLAIHTFSTLVSLIGSGEEVEADKAILTTLISSNVLFNPHTDVTTRPMLILDLMLQHIPNPSMEASCTRYLRSLVGVLPQFTQFIALLDGDKRASLLLLVMDMDDGRTGIGEYVILQELRDLDEALVELVSIGLSVAEEHVVKRALVVHQITSILQFLVELHKGRPYLAEDVRHYLTRNEEAVSKLGDCFYLMTRDDIITEFSAPLAHELASSAIRQERKELALFLLITVLRSVRLTTQPLSAADALSTSLSLSDFLFETSSLSHAELDQIFIELGAVIVHLSSQPSEDLDEIEPIAQAIFSLLELVKHQQDRVGWNRAAVKVEEEEYADYDDEIGSSSGAGRSCPMVLPGLTEDVFQRLVDFYDTALPEADRSISSFKHDIGWSVPRSDLTPVYPLQSSAPLITSIAMIQTALDAKEETASTPPPPSTPPAILGLVSLSPFTALRSPTTRVTTLTKTYANNDFRQLRTSPHMNTSRPPSMHVDDFELSNSPTASVRPLPPQLLPSHIPSNW
ncbi:hypothetical protein FRC02_012035 [Tulasnella sp. 418]|nr:hypothetical protein FRC02_012035 [Tulasnella sp. 418]